MPEVNKFPEGGRMVDLIGIGNLIKMAENPNRTAIDFNDEQIREDMGRLGAKYKVDVPHTDDLVADLRAFEHAVSTVELT